MFFLIITSIFFSNLKAEIIEVKAKRIKNSPTTLNSKTTSMGKYRNTFLDSLLPGQTAYGSNQTVFARGLDSYHTKVEIDGIEANDLSAPNKTFNFTFSPPTANGDYQYMGAESSIYANDLGPSNISYTTTFNHKNKNQLTFMNGSFGQNKFIAKVSDHIELDTKLIESMTYSFLGQIEELQGQDLSQSGGDKDGSSKKDLHLKWQGNKGPHEIQLLAHSYFFNENLDGDIDANGKQNENSQRSLKSDIYLLGVNYKNNFNDSSYYLLSLTENISKKNDTNRQNPYAINNVSQDIFQGQEQWIKNKYFYENKDNEYFVESHFNFGDEVLKTKTSYEQSHFRLSKQSYGLKGQKEFGNFFVFSGFTITNRENSKDGSNITIGEGIELNNRFKIQGQYGVSNVQPSIYQLRNPTYGNAGLKNEELETYSMIFSYTSENENLKTKITPYQTNITNRFSNDPDNNFKSINSGDAKVQGVQNDLSFTYKKIQLTHNNIIQDPRDLNTGKRLLRRTKFSTYETINYTISDNFSFLLGHTFKGKREEPQKSLAPYQRWDISAFFNFKEFNTSLSIENVLNKKYQDTFEVLPAQRTFLAMLSWTL